MSQMPADPQPDRIRPLAPTNQHADMDQESEDEDRQEGTEMLPLPRRDDDEISEITQTADIVDSVSADVPEEERQKASRRRMPPAPSIQGEPKSLGSLGGKIWSLFFDTILILVSIGFLTFTIIGRCAEGNRFADFELRLINASRIVSRSRE